MSQVCDRVLADLVRNLSLRSVISANVSCLEHWLSSATGGGVRVTSAVSGLFLSPRALEALTQSSPESIVFMVDPQLSALDSISSSITVLEAKICPRESQLWYIMHSMTEPKCFTTKPAFSFHPIQHSSTISVCNFNEKYTKKINITVFLHILPSPKMFKFGSVIRPLSLKQARGVP